MEVQDHITATLIEFRQSTEVQIAGLEQKMSQQGRDIAQLQSQARVQAAAVIPPSTSHVGSK